MAFHRCVMRSRTMVMSGARGFELRFAVPATTRGAASRAAYKPQQRSGLMTSPHLLFGLSVKQPVWLVGRGSGRLGPLRSFCTPKSGKDTAKATKQAESAGEKYALQATTAVEGVKTAGRTGVLLSVAGLVVVCGYLILTELMPTRMSPSSVFSEALRVVQAHNRVQELVGTPVKGYGNDHGGRAQGRRNFVANEQFKDDDGIDHTRVRFNIEGPRGKGVVYADVSSSMGKGQFFYLIVDVPKKALFPIQDNRPKIPLAVRQGEVTNALAAAGAVLYGAEHTCEYTRKQLKEFGTYLKRVKYVDCNEEWETCQRIGITSLPAWVINRRLVLGYKTLEDLDAIAKSTARK